MLSGLVSADQIEAADKAVRARPGPPTPITQVEDKDLAEQLVGMELLTEYQAQQLLAGRTKLTLGPYMVTDFIGQGGMGQVFKGVHTLMGREVAIKVLPKSKSTPDSINNFNREIRTQAKLDHPNLVRAYDAGHDGNVYYLVCEYVPGLDLRRLVRRNGALDMHQAARVISQSAQALEHAHEAGLIHRDVKPGNILVTPEGVAKVSDLGLAGFSQDENDPRAGKIVGTADYLSPEQIRAPREVTHTSDIYSLGCTLYYAITGKVPFPGGDTADKARRHLDENPWHPRKFCPDIAEDFVEVIADMMEKKPENRIQTAAEVVSRLEPWASEQRALPQQKMLPSRWLDPPPPTGPADEEDLSVLAGSDGRVESPSQISQATPGGSRDETRGGSLDSVAVPPPLPNWDGSRLDVRTGILIALAIAIPVAMAVGSAITLLLMQVLS